MKAPVTACLIVRDEAENLPACLESVRESCAEIVVVDTGSKDGTEQLAAELGARVFHFPWIDDFSAARNYAAQHATQPFILRLDADERLEPGSGAALQAYCEGANGAAGRVRLTNVQPNGDNNSEYLTCLYPRLADYRYERRIHEQLRYRGSSPSAINTDVMLLHTGYAPEVIESRGKAERNLRLLELDLAETPGDPYLHYQVAKTRYVMQDYAAAAREFEAALELLDGRPAHEISYLSSIFLQQAYCFTYLQDLRGAQDVIAAGVELFPDYTDLYFVYGVALMQLGGAARVSEMLAAFEYCLELGEPDPRRYSTVAGVGSFRAQHNLGAFREAVGDLEGAQKYYVSAAAAGFPPSIERMRARVTRPV